MSRLRFSITMSLDGYVAGPNQSVTNPLGEGGQELHNWAFATRSWRKQHEMEGGATGADDDIIAESLLNIGATIMGRLHTPVFVLTHYARNPLEMQGGTTFHFVTDGIQAALEQAKNAARGKDVALGGGADVAQQYLKVVLIDEMEIHVVPLFLGGGSRLFEKTHRRQMAYECARVVNSPSVSHYKYRRAR